MTNPLGHHPRPRRLDIQLIGAIALTLLLVFEAYRSVQCERRGGTMRITGAWYQCVQELGRQNGSASPVERLPPLAN
jgi:hypothetical protein